MTAPVRSEADRIARRDWSLLDKMYGWLWQKQDQVPPSPAVGKATALDNYSLAQTTRLLSSVTRPRTCEQETRPFVIGHCSTA